MQKIGIIVADKQEMSMLPGKLLLLKKINQFQFYILENNIIFVCSGIGIVNAAAAAQELISSFGVTELWNYGAVGGSEKVNIYDLITPARIYFHDVKTPWYQRGQTPGEKAYWSNGVSGAKNNYLASGNSFVDKSNDLRLISLQLHCDIFDMEAAAIAQIAAKNHVECKIIKCVSDIVGTGHYEHLININKRIKKAGYLAFSWMLQKISK